MAEHGKRRSGRAAAEPTKAGAQIRRRRRRPTIQVPTTDAFVVTRLPPGDLEPAEHPEAPSITGPGATAGCVFSASAPTSSTSTGAVAVASYSVAGDAVSTDSVTFKGGTQTPSFRLVPIFYGSAWLKSDPSSSDVNAAIRALVASPYLSELDQYGFSSLHLLLPVLVSAAAPATHEWANSGDIVWSLIKAGTVPALTAPPDAAIYALFYPNGTSVSNIAACGWHYRSSGAWVAAIEWPDAAADAAETQDNIVRIFSHELVETITDPDGDAGWTMNREINKGTEIGDACNNTDDFTDGLFVNAYWSERARACVIPKPRGTALLSSTLEELSTTVVTQGLTDFRGDPFDIRTCLHGAYTYSIEFVACRARFFATSSNFPTPTTGWRLLEAKGGPMSLPAGFAGTVILSTDTWIEGPTGTTKAVSDVPVHVQVLGDELHVTADSMGLDFASFSVYAEVTFTGGAMSASATARQSMPCQRLTYEDRLPDRPRQLPPSPGRADAAGDPAHTADRSGRSRSGVDRLRDRAVRGQGACRHRRAGGVGRRGDRDKPSRDRDDAPRSPVAGRAHTDGRARADPGQRRVIRIGRPSPKPRPAGACHDAQRRPVLRVHDHGA